MKKKLKFTYFAAAERALGISAANISIYLSGKRKLTKPILGKYLLVNSEGSELKL